MNATSRSRQPDFEGLPNITFRQLEVFRVVCREESYANAALELRSTRANIKRVCNDFENAVGRPLFVEGPNRTLQPTGFAKGLLEQAVPLARGLRRLGESVKGLHEKGRILRFAAAGELFKGGLFTDFIGRLQITDTFQPCFQRIETKRFRTSLLNAECDVYVGVGITASDRLDLVNLCEVPWKIKTGSRFRGKPPAAPAGLPEGKWWIAEAGEPDATAAVVARFHAAGAKGGRILVDADDTRPADDEIVFSHETTGCLPKSTGGVWPMFSFSAVLRKHHPYTELLPRLTAAASS